MSNAFASNESELVLSYLRPKKKVRKKVSIITPGVILKSKTYVLFVHLLNCY